MARVAGAVTHRQAVQECPAKVLAEKPGPLVPLVVAAVRLKQGGPTEPHMVETALVRALLIRRQTMAAVVEAVSVLVLHRVVTVAVGLVVPLQMVRPEQRIQVAVAVALVARGQ